MPKRLSQKLALSLTAIVIIVVGISGVINVKTQERQLLDAMIIGADQLSKGITSATWHAMMRDHRETAFQVMQAIATTHGIDRIRIFNRTGDLMFSTDQSDTGRKFDKNSASCSSCHGSGKPKVNLDTHSRVRILTHNGGSRSLVMVTPIYNSPTCSQAACHAHPPEVRVLGVLDVALNLEPVDREVRAMQTSAFVTTGIAILLVSVFIIFSTHHFVTTPIRGLIAGTKAVSAMELDKPVAPIHSSEELNELARSFNSMRERLQVAILEISQFTQSLEAKVEDRTRQLKAAHQKLLQSDRLASLGQLAASVAHEINNPLSSMLNFTMLMQRIVTDDGIPPQRLEEFRRYLSLVAGETGRVGRIVSDLLAFSRRSKPQRTRSDVNALLRGTLSLVSHKLKLAGAEVDLSLDETLPRISCDGPQIQQVLMNLMLNAAEALQHRPGRISIRTSVAGEFIAIVVEDTGDGIQPEDLPRIFDPFFTTKAEGKGVGLGLAVSYGIVQAHGGDIEVKSTLGQGTVFTVTLPLEAAPQEAQVQE